MSKGNFSQTSLLFCRCQQFLGGPILDGILTLGTGT